MGKHTVALLVKSGGDHVECVKNGIPVMVILHVLPKQMMVQHLIAQPAPAQAHPIHCLLHFISTTNFSFLLTTYRRILSHY
jgi:hypothetical protein